MAVKETYGPPKDDWPSADELTGIEGVMILPDQVEESAGELVAGFRSDTQELRVDAKQRGIAITLYAPPGATLGVYEEHAAEWILPVLMSAPVTLATSLLVNLIQRRIDAWRARGAPAPAPEVRCGLAEVENGKVRVRDLEGPAEEVRDILLGLGELAAGGDDVVDDEAGD